MFTFVGKNEESNGIGPGAACGSSVAVKGGESSVRLIWNYAIRSRGRGAVPVSGEVVAILRAITSPLAYEKTLLSATDSRRVLTAASSGANASS